MPTSERTPDDVYYTPKQVSERLGIGTPMLRRYAASYERAFGDLNRDTRDGRLYTETDVRRIEAARALVSDGPYASIDDALAQIAKGDESVDQTLTKAAEPTFEETVLGMMSTLLERSATREQIDALRRELPEAMSKQLASGEDAEKLKAERDALKAELEETKEQLERSKRPWWKWWQN